MILPLADGMDVQRELAAMRAELAAIRTQMRDEWMDASRAESIRGIVRDALADSATRASFLDREWDAGYLVGNGGGAYFRARDGSATMRLSGMVQSRFVAASAYGPDTPTSPQANSPSHNQATFLTGPPR